MEHRRGLTALRSIREPELFRRSRPAFSFLQPLKLPSFAGLRQKYRPLLRQTHEDADPPTCSRADPARHRSKNILPPAPFPNKTRPAKADRPTLRSVLSSHDRRSLPELRRFLRACKA